MLAGEFIRNLMRSNGNRGQIIHGESLSEEQQRQIQLGLREQANANQRGFFRSLFLPAKVTVTDPPILQPDQALIDQRIENRKEIYIAFGIPATFAEPKARYSIGSITDRAQLIGDACMPLAAKIADGIEVVTAKLLGASVNQTIFAWFDFDEHPVMQEVRAQRFDSALKLQSLGVPLEIINENLKLGLPPVPGWETVYSPGRAEVTSADNKSDEEDSSNSDTKPLAVDPNEPDPTTKLLQLFQARVETSSPSDKLLLAFQKRAQAKAAPKPVIDVVEKITHPLRDELWNKHFERRRPVEKAFQSKINSVLTKARSEVLSKLTKDLSTTTTTKAKKNDNNNTSDNDDRDYMFDVDQFTKDLTKALEKLQRSTLNKAGEETYLDIEKKELFSIPEAEVERFIDKRKNLIRNASQEIFDSIQSEINHGLEHGQTIDEIADRVRAKFNEASKGRAKTIAITETGAAYSAGSHRAMLNAGITRKEWLSSRDKKVRPTHRYADGQVVAVNDTFNVGGEALYSPCDSNGSAGNCCNCRCIAIPVR